MVKLLNSIVLVLLFISGLTAQSTDLEKMVSLNYRNVRLGDALQGISQEYNVYFSYSKHYVPVDKRVNVMVESQPLHAALDVLFEETEVVYANIGDQIVLKKGKQPGKINQIENHDFPIFGSAGSQKRAIDGEEADQGVFTASNRPFGEVFEVPVLRDHSYGLPEVLSEETAQTSEFDSERYYIEAPKPEPNYTTAQVSLVPAISTNSDEAKERTNNISFNVLGGENGGVDGVEIGGLFNKVTNDVNGVQIAGLFNKVGGDVGPSKMIDGEKNKTFGVQIAGLFNTADDAHAVQLSGLFNKNRGSFRGFQYATLGNTNGGDAQGVQLAGLFNINKGDGKVQIAGVSNISGDVKGTQISGLFNRAKKVDGVQFSLINVCDTVSGASIGLLNFVWKGYNQIEVGGSETMQTQLAIRFGSRRFYNIIQGGVHYDDQKSYGLGYGIGTTIRNQTSEKWQWNAELLASQIFEESIGYRNLNLLSTFRLTAEYKMFKWSSFYIGPTANLMLTDLVNSENINNNIAGSQIPRYTLFDNKNNVPGRTMDVKAWIGIRAGLRFGRN